MKTITVTEFIFLCLFFSHLICPSTFLTVYSQTVNEQFSQSAFSLPVQVRLVLVYIDVVKRIHAEPRVESKAILVGPFCYWRHCDCL